MVDYNNDIKAIRKLYGEMPRAYLDNAAAPLYPHTIPKAMAEFLCCHTLVNPHSKGSLGHSTISMIEKVRSKVLELVHADPAEYSVVFTASATASAKLVGESLGSRNFTYLVDSHTSIVGLRMLSKQFQAVETIKDVPRDGIVSWPAQSNFDGRLYPSAEWIRKCHDQNALVLLDAASYCATKPLDLRAIEPDMVIVSFYKMFGLPDLGGLIVRNSPGVIDLLRSRQYFGGGTVDAVTPRTNFVARRQRLCESLEDGTLPFHTIAMLGVAIDEFFKLYGSFDAVAEHTGRLAADCWRRLQDLPGVHLWSRDPDSSLNGAIVTFSLDDCGHSEFATAAMAADIHVRAGTLCNIGAFAQATGLDDASIVVNHTDHGKVCNDNVDTLNGMQTGVIRASFGPYTSQDEIDVLVDFIASICTPRQLPTVNAAPVATSVAELYVYPIKSCAGTRVDTSVVGGDGLEHDREFCLVNLQTSRVMSLKRTISMAKVHSYVRNGVLFINAGGNTIEVPTNLAQWKSTSTLNKTEKLVLNMDRNLIEFLTESVGEPCTLAKGVGHLTNASPMLLISKASADALDCDWRVFRANIVLSASQPWSEDQWQAISIGNSKVTCELLGRCRRCNMVCVTSDGKSSAHPYLQLCRHRKFDGKLWFGQHMRLKNKSDGGDIRVGDKVTVLKSLLY